MKDSGSLNTILGKGSSIDGNFDIQGSVRIEGAVKGDVKCTDLLTIGVAGSIKGSVWVKDIILAGTISGNIVASEKVELQNKSIVEGDIIAKSLVIEAGAIFHGLCNMKNGCPPKTEVSSINKKND